MKQYQNDNTANFVYYGKTRLNEDRSFILFDSYVYFFA